VLKFNNPDYICYHACPFRWEKLAKYALCDCFALYQSSSACLGNIDEILININETDMDSLTHGGVRGFEIRVFLLLDELPTKAYELHLPKL
jgi:hypothetical protein